MTMMKILYIISFVLFLSALGLYYLNLPLYTWIVIYVMYTIISFIIFQIIRRYFHKNRDKIEGRGLEMLFFLFLFGASYCVTLYVGNMYREYMTIGLIITLIGAVHFGYMHYIDGLYSDKQK